ncbi:conserved hypothetical protein [Limnobacter sp. 130]|uniref:hypothetical protein n=1 Tax=Limnobacter sp. 130 TaxID=2653147 RepID=UPI0012F08781|nr:hypothetical protein [Limnobacter sp. 130]VWX35762.1 conserved hypothetical protein [Limnobacter sp. 130]
MALIGSKQLALMALALMTGCFYLGVLGAAEPLALKVSEKLGNRMLAPANTVDREKPMPGLLGKVSLFRGVAVDEGVVIPSNLKTSKTGLAVSAAKPESLIKAIYGGLQVSLQENLSLVYTPGRLSSTTLNSESQGLYLLTNRGGLANWFFGVESSSYSTTADSRQVSNSAKFGVIVSLN